MNNKKKVLIIGSSAKEYALAKYLHKLDYIEQVYVAPGNFFVGEFAQRLDIRETDVDALLEFAIKNDIDMTIASSSEAIKADIVSNFKENSQPIFAPSVEAAGFALSAAISKKFLYKLHLQTAKFGIFDKLPLASDYIKNEKYPLLITTEYNAETAPRAVCATVLQAQRCLNDIFSQDESRVVIEEYLYGHPFTLYVISDGYSALPINVVGDYKFQNDGDGGFYTLGAGAYLPDYKVSLEQVSQIMENVVSKIMTNLQNRGTPYIGILGIECVLNKENQCLVVGFTPFLKDHDAQAVLSSLDIDLYAVMEACINGSFADDYEDILLKDNSIISCVLSARKDGSVITGLEMVDDTTDISYFGCTKNEFFETLTNKGRTLVITQSAGTLSRARELLYDNIEDIYFDGITFRRDICSE